MRSDWSARGIDVPLEIVEAVILKLDASDIRQRKNTVVKLKNTMKRKTVNSSRSSQSYGHQSFKSVL